MYLDIANPWTKLRYLDEQSFRFNERKDEFGDGGRFESVTNANLC
jgi:hypothetical protein